jgi:hypothetical protein
MSSKRRQSELVIDDRQLTRDRDYFDVIVCWRPSNSRVMGEGDEMLSDRSSSHESRQHQHHKSPLSSWLCNVDWLVSPNEAARRPPLRQQQQQQKPKQVELNNSDTMIDDNDDN